MNDIKINLPAGGVVTYMPVGLGGMEVTVTVPKPAEPVRTITVDFAKSQPSESVAFESPAPAPPPQTEAERLVGIARSLPSEATTEWDRMADCNVDAEGDIWIGDGCYHVPTFRTILLGVMAAYVGTEPNAHVVIGRNGVVIWTSCLDDAFHDTPDLLTAYRDCCLAIARKRKEAGNGR